MEQSRHRSSLLPRFSRNNPTKFDPLIQVLQPLIGLKLCQCSRKDDSLLNARHLEFTYRSTFGVFGIVKSTFSKDLKNFWIPATEEWILLEGFESFLPKI